MSEWQENTGEQPVDDNVPVQVVFREDDRSGMEPIFAGELDWSLMKDGSDIIEWRIHNG